jgi:hypothetical protein
MISMNVLLSFNFIGNDCLSRVPFSTSPYILEPNAQICTSHDSNKLWLKPQLIFLIFKLFISITMGSIESLTSTPNCPL